MTYLPPCSKYVLPRPPRSAYEQLDILCAKQRLSTNTNILLDGETAGLFNGILVPLIASLVEPIIVPLIR